MFLAMGIVTFAVRLFQRQPPVAALPALPPAPERRAWDTLTHGTGLRIPASRRRSLSILDALAPRRSLGIRL